VTTSNWSISSMDLILLIPQIGGSSLTHSLSTPQCTTPPHLYAGFLEDLIKWLIRLQDKLLVLLTTTSLAFMVFALMQPMLMSVLLLRRSNVLPLTCNGSNSFLLLINIFSFLVKKKFFLYIFLCILRVCVLHHESLILSLAKDRWNQSIRAKWVIAAKMILAQNESSWLPRA